jgi:TP901 family phage tail tape measure protein
MGDVSDKMRGDMRAAAIEVSKTTMFSASQAADAFFYLSSAGYSAEQALKSMPVVANFAQAGYFDLAQATNMLADSQSALGMRTGDAQKDMVNMTRISDVLSKANIIANAEVQDFAAALQNNAAGALRLVNKEVEEGVAVLAADADQGIKGEEAGTALGIVMRDLQTKSLKHAAAFKTAGVEVFNAGGKMNNMADIIEYLEQRLEGLSDAQKKQQLLTMGFADRSVAFLQTLIGTSDRIREYEGELRNASGTTSEIADKIQTPLDKALNQFKGRVQELAEAMAPAIKIMAEYIDGVSRIRLAPDKNGEWSANNYEGTPETYRTDAIAAEEGSWAEFARAGGKTDREINAFNVRRMLQGDFSGSEAYARMMDSHNAAVGAADAPKTGIDSAVGSFFSSAGDKFRAGANMAYNYASRPKEYIRNKQHEQYLADEEKLKTEAASKADSQMWGKLGKDTLMNNSFLGNTLKGFGLDSLDKITEKAGSAIRSAGDFANGIPGSINRFSREHRIGKYHKGVGDSLAGTNIQTARAQDPLSREGMAQRVRSIAQDRGKGTAEQQLTSTKKAERHLSRIEKALNNPLVMAAANIA